MGGAWKSMIRKIRKILHSILRRQTLNDESCLNFMTEVESIINSRPLVPVSFSDTTQEPLTPNHLLLLGGNPNLPPGIFTESDCYSRRRWAQIQYLANQFWRRWINEFYPIIYSHKNGLILNRSLKLTTSCY